VTAVHFADSFPGKNNFDLSKCLYIGTSLGSVLVIVIVVPEAETRERESVIVSPSGSLLRLKSPILEFCLLDSSFALAERPDLESVKATSRNVSGRVVGSQDGSEVAAPQGDQLVLAIGTERGASVFALPSQRQVATHALPESSSVVVAKAVDWGKDKSSPLLLSFTSDGKVKALSLPTLRTLLESPLILNINPASTASTRIFKTISFSAGGSGLFFTNQNQVQKFSVNKEYTKALYESFGDFYQEGIEMPEPPKQGFFKGFFGGGAKPLDREELFGGSNASSTIAVKTEGAKMTAAQASAAAGGSEIAKAKEAVCERGNKLNEVEEKTEQMANDAKIWADTSKQLLDKYKNKKWYQL